MARITPPSRRSLPLVFVVLVLVLAVAPLARAADEGGPRAKESETWGVDALTQSDNGIEVAHLWSKGRKFREERVIQMMPILTLVNGDTYYSIDVLSGRGVAITRGPKAIADDAKGGRPMDQQIQTMIRRGAEKIGSERIAGRSCVGYQLTDNKGKQTVWITDDALRLPVRTEVFDRKSGRSADTRYSWARDLPIPDSFFEPDPRIQLERVGYDEYRQRSGAGPVGPVPVLHGHLLHGEE